MALELTIAAMQGAIMGDDTDLQAEALALLGDPDSRKQILSNHGIDPTELDDDTVLTLLLEHSRDGLD